MEPRDRDAREAAEDKIREAVTQELVNKSLMNIIIKSKVKNFLDGSLYFVYYYLEQDSREHLYYVYLCGDEVSIIKSIDQLANIMSIYRPERGSRKFIENLFSAQGIAAIIAILVLGTIIFLIAFKGIEKPPDILAAAFTSVLGFYFGSQVTKK
jgi:hypothetical protein